MGTAAEVLRENTKQSMFNYKHKDFIFSARIGWAWAGMVLHSPFPWHYLLLAEQLDMGCDRLKPVLASLCRCRYV